MCVAIIIPAGVDTPSDEVLQKCEMTNPDGGGVAFPTQGSLLRPRGVKWVKGLSAKAISKILKSVPTDVPRFVHFRIATIGGANAQLCHPFPVSDRVGVETSGMAKAVLMHNGHWSDWDRFLPRGEKRSNWTDTRVMAHVAHLYGASALGLIPSSQKIAVLKSDGHITNFGEWREKDGVLFSNLYWDWKSNGKYYYRSSENYYTVDERYPIWNDPNNNKKMTGKERRKMTREQRNKAEIEKLAQGAQITSEEYVKWWRDHNDDAVVGRNDLDAQGRQPALVRHVGSYDHKIPKPERQLSTTQALPNSKPVYLSAEMAEVNRVLSAQRDQKLITVPQNDLLVINGKK